VVPDLSSLGTVANDPLGESLRFFAGVPLAMGTVSVGALCFADHEPRSFGADGYAVLEAIGRRGSAVISGRESEVADVCTSSGLLTREGLGVVLGAELSRMDREPLSLMLFAFAGPAPAEQLEQRTAVAELGERRFVALIARSSPAEAERALRHLLAAIGSGFGGGGLVEVEPGAQTLFDVPSLLHAADRLLSVAQTVGPCGITRMVVRREPKELAAEPAAP
jgi:hypothetical protein